MYEILLALVIATVAVAQSEKVPDTAEAIFQEAVGHWGDSGNDAAMVTIVDGHTGHHQAICVEADVLGSAVSIEYGMKWWPGNMSHVTDRMRSHHDRQFVFLNENALEVVGKERNYADYDQDLCKLLRKNVYAYRGDRPPTLYVGQLRNR